MTHTSFATTTRGLNRELPSMRLYEKARSTSLKEINRVARETEDA